MKLTFSLVLTAILVATAIPAMQAEENNISATITDGSLRSDSPTQTGMPITIVATVTGTPKNAAPVLSMTTWTTMALAGSLASFLWYDRA
ncbi:hypothetical protein IWQ61_007992 [Dispira simplex]|nr:hypothetical protein IWQ61_007992 [Dispira simplex]